MTTRSEPPDSEPPDDRIVLAKAYALAARVMNVAIGMIVPGLLGRWVDSRLGTVAVLTILGFGLGLGWGIWQLMRLTEQDRLDSETKE